MPSRFSEMTLNYTSSTVRPPRFFLHSASMENTPYRPVSLAIHSWSLSKGALNPVPMATVTFLFVCPACSTSASVCLKPNSFPSFQTWLRPSIPYFCSIGASYFAQRCVPLHDRANTCPPSSFRSHSSFCLQCPSSTF